MGIPVTGLDQLGFLYDRKPYTLPPNAWSDVKNVRFLDGSVYTTYGHQAVLGVPQVPSYYLHTTRDLSLLPIFAYAGLAEIWATDGTTHQEITRAAGDYTGTENDLWQAFDFGGISIFNNGVDVPQAWIGRQLSQQLVDLANWPATARARVLRGFRRFIFAFDVTKSGVRYPQLVKWSHEADPGLVPSTWDETDETKDAGEYPLIDTSGEIIDALPLSDAMVIYKSDAVYFAQYIGGTFIFNLPLAFRGFGALAQRCIGEWRKKHVVVFEDNVFLNDGFKFESLLQERSRRWFASRIDSTNAFRTFLAINESEDEAWICFPETGETFPNLALCVNLHTGAAAPRDLPDVAHIEYGRTAALSGSSYDQQNIPFDEMVGYFGQAQNTLTKKRLLGVSPKVARNYLTRSDEIDHGDWSKGLLNVTANSRADPVTGAMTVDTAIPTAANGTHVFSQQRNKLVATPISCYVEAKFRQNGYTGVILIIDDGTNTNRVRATIDLTNGDLNTVTSEGTFTGVQAEVEALADGFYRLRVSGNTDANAVIRARVIILQNAVGSSTFTGDGVSGVFVGGLQLREGPISTQYQPTTSVAAISAFYLFDAGYDFDGVPFTAYVERIGLTISGKNMDGSTRNDPTVYKFFKELWPKLEILNGESIQIRAGGQEFPEGSVMWSPVANFSPATDLFVPVDLECRYESVRFESSNREFWRLTEYDVEVSPIGRFTSV